MEKTLKSLKVRYEAIGKRLLAPVQYLRWAETPQHDGSPHIEYEGDQFIYVVTERGRRFGEKRTTDPDELLYWLVSDVTWAMASDFEKTHRHETEDSRRQLFAKHLELLESVDSEWAHRKRAEYADILRQYPYQDPPK